MTESWQRPRLFEAITRAIRIEHSGTPRPRRCELVRQRHARVGPLPACERAVDPRDRGARCAHGGSGFERAHPGPDARHARPERAAGGRAQRPVRGGDGRASRTGCRSASRSPLSESTLFEETDGHPLLVVELARIGPQGDSSDLRRASPLPDALRSEGPGHLLPARMRAVIAARLDQLTDRRSSAHRARGRVRSGLRVRCASRRERPGRGRSRWRRSTSSGDAGWFESAAWAPTTSATTGSATWHTARHRRPAAGSFTGGSPRRSSLLHGPDLDPVAGQIAAHLEAAGQTGRAAELYERAAEVAGRVSAFAEVMRSLDRALALLSLEAPSRSRDERELALQFRRSPAASRRRGLLRRPAKRRLLSARAPLRSRSVVPVMFRFAIPGAAGVAVVGGRIDEAIAVRGARRRATASSGRRLQRIHGRSAAAQIVATATSRRGIDERSVQHLRGYRPGLSRPHAARRRRSCGACVCMGSVRAVAERPNRRSATRGRLRPSGEPRRSMIPSR